SPQYMGKMEPQWSLLQYSLLRVDEFIYGLTIKFMEQGSHSINHEETEKLKAVATVYKEIREEVKKQSDHPELIINSLIEQMKIIDDHYSTSLERIGYYKN